MPERLKAAVCSAKYFDWDDAKNAKFSAERGIGFEDIVFHIERGDLLDTLEHRTPAVCRSSKTSTPSS